VTAQKIVSQCAVEGGMFSIWSAGNPSGGLQTIAITSVLDQVADSPNLTICSLSSVPGQWPDLYDMELKSSDGTSWVYADLGSTNINNFSFTGHTAPFSGIRLGLTCTNTGCVHTSGAGYTSW
jgi:hypothetical protein